MKDLKQAWESVLNGTATLLGDGQAISADQAVTQSWEQGAESNKAKANFSAYDIIENFNSEKHDSDLDCWIAWYSAKEVEEFAETW